MRPTNQWQRQRKIHAALFRRALTAAVVESKAKAANLTDLQKGRATKTLETFNKLQTAITDNSFDPTHNEPYIITKGTSLPEFCQEKIVIVVVGVYKI